MIKACATDKQLIISILTAAFETNKSVNHVVKQDAKKQQRIEALMDYSYEVCRQWGEIYLSDDCLAAAMLLYPHQKRTSLKAIWLDLKLALKAVGLAKLKQVMNRESRIKSFHPQQPFLYLWFVGVVPDQQGKGIGSRLMAEIIQQSERIKLPVFLETSTRENLPFYQNSGFQIYAQIDFDYPLYLLKRDLPS